MSSSGKDKGGLSLQKVTMHLWISAENTIIKEQPVHPSECCRLKLSQHLASFFGFFLHMLLKTEGESTSYS